MSPPTAPRPRHARAFAGEALRVGRRGIRAKLTLCEPCAHRADLLPAVRSHYVAACRPLWRSTTMLNPMQVCKAFAPCPVGVMSGLVVTLRHVCVTVETRVKNGHRSLGITCHRWISEVPLLWQPGIAERLTERGGKCRLAIHAGKKPAVTEHRLQFQDAGCGSLRFFETPELGKRSGQRHVAGTETWTALYRFVRGGCSLFISAALEVPERQRIESGGTPRV